MKTIMIVDDTESVRKTVRIILSRTYKVIEADGVTMMFDVLKKEKPDVILLDVMMPDGNGMVAKTRLKGSKEYKDIPVVFVTAVEDDKVKDIAKIQSVRYIIKPFTKDELLKAIEEALEE